MKLPYIKFYTRDWLGDKQLRLCSDAAKGLWVDLMCIMADNEQNYGYLEMNGEPLSIGNIVQLRGGDKDTVNRLIEELDKSKVFSRNSKDVIFSRRMVKDHEKRQKCREAGKRGGNPSLILLSEEKKESEDQILEPRTHIRLSQPLREESLSSSILIEFNECWKIYPDKAGKDRAWKAYKQARQDGITQADVLSGLNRYIAYVRGRQASDFKDLKFKNGGTWFHQKCWNDEYTVQQSTSAGMYDHPELDDLLKHSVT